MGRTYRAKSDEDLRFDTNLSGTRILSLLHEHFNLDHANYTLPSFAGQIDPPWEATASRARKMGQAIEDLSDDQIKAFFEEKIAGRKLFDPAAHPEDFVEHIREWQNFLLKCGGYDV